MVPNDVDDLRETLIDFMCTALEDALAYFSTHEIQLYHFYCGKAVGFEHVLNQLYGINAEDLHDEHIDAMLAFVEEHW